jgi:hypothetical protein
LVDDPVMEVPGEGEEEPEFVWPPRISDPPRLPYSEDFMDLALDPAGRVPEAPEFSPSRLTGRIAHTRGNQERPDPVPGAVVYDPRNPSGRTRGDKVLRPTAEDRVERLWRKRRDAALTGAAVVGAILLILVSPSALLFLTTLVVAAIAGWVAYDLGDSEVTWAASMAVVGIPLGWNYGVQGMLIAVLFMAGTGWFTGFARDANLS